LLVKLLIRPSDIARMEVRLFPNGYAESSTQVVALRTERLRLRGWRSADIERLNVIRRQFDVTRFVSADKGLRNISIENQLEPWARFGFGPWAVELRSTGQFIGSIGMSFPGHWPSPELSWVLDSHHWNRGYATEGAKAVADFAFTSCGVDELIAICTPANHRSERVMKKLGMTRNDVVTCAKRSIPITQYTLAIGDWRSQTARG
jgi:RimJ/RimL family protein N-acetyltransferase